jgi:2-polyprenyl-3-methyl-5-hydroxy-6-metoxy-1,4-benzoquinol methylase
LVETYHDPLGNKDYGSFLCPECEVVFANPYQHPGPEWYRQFASADSYEGLGMWRFDWFFSLGFKPGGRLLDVGCGTGNFLLRAKDKGYRVVGVDLNPGAVAAARQRGLDVQQESLEAYAAKSPGGEFDMVTMFDVIEHFDNPAEMVAIAHRLLKPGGGFIVTTPNGYRPTPFGRDDFDSPPHHLSRWTPEALENLMARYGFRTESSYYTMLPTWEFSRFFVGRATKGVLALSKRLLYGKQASSGTLTQLIDQAPKKGGIVGLIQGKDLRTRLVLRFEKVLEWILSPVFLPMKVYYRIKTPKAGCTTCLLVSKES